MKGGHAGGQFIAVAGSVATGKSGLVRQLSKELGATPLLEDIGRNPYFDRFYEDPKSWAFHSQAAFAADSLRRHCEALGSGAVIQDRTVYETIDVFARMLFELGHLSAIDLKVLESFGECASHLARQPTVLLYLCAPVPALLGRIAKRSRPAERVLSADYLAHLEERYESFIEDWSLCPVVRIDTEARDLRAPSEVNQLLTELDL